MLAPVLTPWIGEHWGWPIGIGLGAVVRLIGAVSWCWIKPEEADKARIP
jgi:dipeptide/tripeptide permease